MAIFTGRIERAIALAIRAHDAQVRKGDGQLPYVVHPVTVALILSRYTGDEDTIIAGLLHDTLEDTLVTAGSSGVRREGPRHGLDVASPTCRALVGGAWARYLRRLQTARGLLVAGADKITNLIWHPPHASAGDALWGGSTAARLKLGFYR
jgi:hypothetical protein